MKKRTIVIVLAVALLLVLVMAGTAYGGTPSRASAPMTAGLVQTAQDVNADGSVMQYWWSWAVIEGVNGRPDKGGMTYTILTFGPSGKLVSQTSEILAVTDVSRLNRTTMEFFVPYWQEWLKVVDGGWPGVKKDAWYYSLNGTTWLPGAILAGNIIVF